MRWLDDYCKSVDSIASPPAASITLSLLTADEQTQPVLTQGPSVSVAPGESVTLKCVMSGAQVKDYCVDWYQQKSGSAPSFILEYCAKRGLKRGEGSGEILRLQRSQPRRRLFKHFTCAV